MHPNSPEFKKLQSEWYKKLRLDKFNDIEDSDQNLKTYASDPIRNKRNKSELSLEAQAEFYRAAGHFLWQYPFKNLLERRIWELFAQGLSLDPIVEELKSRRFKKGVSRSPVHRKIQELTKIMLSGKYAEK